MRHALLLALQVLEQRRERHVIGNGADVGADKQARRDRAPKQGLAKAEAGDRRVAQFLKAGRGPAP